MGDARKPPPGSKSIVTIIKAMDKKVTVSPRAAMDEAFLMSAQLSDLMERGVKEIGLTSLRARMLHAIFLLGPLRQRQLSEAMGCSAQQVAAVLDVLGEKELIERQPDPTDRRAHLVSLTKEGATLAQKIESHRSIAAEWLLKDVSPDDLEVFVSVTRHIRQLTAISPSV